MTEKIKDLRFEKILLTNPKSRIVARGGGTGGELFREEAVREPVERTLAPIPIECRRNPFLRTVLKIFNPI
jgi:hypothetical protein